MLLNDEQKDEQMENARARMNFYLSLLVNSCFNVYLANAITPNVYYVMLELSQEELEKECQKNGLQIKQATSYQYKTYMQDNKTDFEPFRSREKQEII